MKQEKVNIKYATEASIVMELSRYQFLQQTELEYFCNVNTEFTKDNLCNIYMILKRRRVSFRSLTFDTSVLAIEYGIQHEYSFVIRTIKLFNTIGINESTRIHCSFPFDSIELENGTDLTTIKLSALIDTAHQESNIREELLDYEVLYVGRSSNRSQNSSIPIGRLLNHSKLQQIYSEEHSRSPDCEIWIMLCSFKQKTITHLDGRVQNGLDEHKVDLNRFMNFQKGVRFSKKHKICFTEAALINYFKPNYNFDFKRHFPKKTHVSYAECYDFDINSVIITIDTSQSTRKLRSAERSQSFVHSAEFYFQDSADRRRLFEFIQ